MMMAIDQYGYPYYDLKHPRKELAARHDLTSSSARKMYIDTKDGESVHIGYIVQDMQYTLYTLVPWKGKS